MVLRVTGIVLPEREERTLFIDGGVLREDPVPGADRLIDGGWLLPGLVDVHTHPGRSSPGTRSRTPCCAATWPARRPRACC